MSNYHGGVRQRRVRTIQRLEAQLKTDKKPMKAGEGTTVNPFVSFKGYLPLTEPDKRRIQKEINILKFKTGQS